MKKLLSVLLVTLMALTFVGCSSKTAEETTEDVTETTTEETTDQSASIANPVVDVDSLETINETLGCAMSQPAVAGHEDVSFSIIDNKLGQYVFTVNGYEYTYRFENDTTDDISGIYDGGDVIFKTTDDTYYEGSDFKAYRWFNMDGQYCIVVTDNGELEKDQFVGICEEFEDYANANLVNGNA